MSTVKSIHMYFKNGEKLALFLFDYETFLKILDIKYEWIRYLMEKIFIDTVFPSIRQS